jgi:hypothetical protein
VTVYEKLDDLGFVKISDDVFICPDYLYKNSQSSVCFYDSYFKVIKIKNINDLKKQLACLGGSLGKSFDL